jgi:hypothetical protein
VGPCQFGSVNAMSFGQRKFQEFCTSIKVTGARARSDLRSKSIAGFMGVSHDFGEATFTCDKGGMRLLPMFL